MNRSEENRENFLRIVKAYLSGEGTDQQKKVVEQYFDLFSHQPDILDDLEKIEVRKVQKRLKSTIDERIGKLGRPILRLWYAKISAAAAVLLLTSIGIYFYNTYQEQNKSFVEAQAIKIKIVPGKNQALLTLANGRRVLLNNQLKGEVAKDQGVHIKQVAEGKIVYQGINSSVAKIAYNQVQTPKGGQYQLTLSDGTRVWLNAASSLKFPLIFQGKDREVELGGEAYFEVAKNKNKPFHVITASQTVEVLGTHFNINAYNDEALVRTTLLEGLVKVNRINLPNEIVLLKPGQQALIRYEGRGINVRQVDTDEAIAWKNGYFMFDNESIENILRKISRWYDVDIKYLDRETVEKVSFSGTLSKYSEVSAVLRKLELTGAIHFKIEGRSIVVMP